MPSNFYPKWTGGWLVFNVVGSLFSHSLFTTLGGNKLAEVPILLRVGCFVDFVVVVGFTIARVFLFFFCCAIPCIFLSHACTSQYKYTTHIYTYV